MLSFNHFLFRKKIEIGDTTERNDTSVIFELSSNVEELIIKRCKDVRLRNIKRTKTLSVINSHRLELGIY